MMAAQSGNQGELAETEILPIPPPFKKMEKTLSFPLYLPSIRTKPTSMESLWKAGKQGEAPEEEWIENKVY